MAKTPNTIYVCQNCGNQQRKWNGQCPDCGEWNTFVEEKFRVTAQTTGKSSAVKNVRFSADAFREVKPISYSEIESQDDARTSSGIEEFDRVLGGGIVDGSIVLIGGAPGIGKSHDLHSRSPTNSQPHERESSLCFGRRIGKTNQNARRAFGIKRRKSFSFS